ncbi:TerC family protein [Ramlibacter ginsenosidimutans]|uniref:TerC family protein n=1 Tax=Ramlibacter ginsenosidimutans TaxID=502333 RepID=A0A934TVE2_9BURK|nr:TerC family protein [Ramlibacter ginsenosidimutans]MBK6008010.1 TerC family protein [Ramlibacter ginsenosidimutans]
MSALMTPEFWVALAQIILINIVLSGDNAVVIALACRALPPRQQKSAILFGSAGAVVLRVVLTFFAVLLLAQPYLKLIGAVLLLWIGIGLLKGDDEDEDHEDQASLWAAIKTIMIADVVMSLDNVIGVAAAAKGNILLLVAGLVISIPLIVFGSTLILKLMGRFPVIITAGAALLGWVAGEMAVSDPVVHGLVASRQWLHIAAPLTGALLVVAIGKWLGRRRNDDDEKGGAAGTAS